MDPRLRWGDKVDGAGGSVPAAVTCTGWSPMEDWRSWKNETESIGTERWLVW